MEVILHKGFSKQLKKLSKKDQERFKNRLALFIKTPDEPELKNHALGGDLSGYWSINVRADIRAHYCLVDEEVALFTSIGTHAQLYG